MLVKKITIEYLWKNIVHRQNIKGESKNYYKEWAEENYIIRDK